MLSFSTSSICLFLLLLLRRNTAIGGGSGFGLFLRLSSCLLLIFCLLISKSNQQSYIKGTLTLQTLAGDCSSGSSSSIGVGTLPSLSLRFLFLSFLAFDSPSTSIESSTCSSSVSSPSSFCLS